MKRLLMLSTSLLYCLTCANAQEANNGNLQRLYEKNPFGNASGSSAQLAQAEPTAPNGLQLRSIYCVDGIWRFSIYDDAQKRSYTLKLGDKYSEETPYAVEFFDDETNTISIMTPIGSYELTLKERDELTAPIISSFSKGKSSSKTKAKTPVKTQQHRGR